MKITKITTYRLPPRWMFHEIEPMRGGGCGEGDAVMSAPVRWKRQFTSWVTI